MSTDECNYAGPWHKENGFCYWRDEVVPQLDRDRAALLEALENLVRFAEELCADVNVSSHYPSVDSARAILRDVEGESNG